jgi:hypothetical protein
MATPLDRAGYPIVQMINAVELPINPAAAHAVDPAIVSSTIWSASPAGLVANGGALVPSQPDATTAERTACAAAAKPLS